jgi:hypothetical protein
MRYLVVLLTILTLLAAAPIPVAAGPLMKPPKLDKMLKPPKHPKPVGASYTGQQSAGLKLFRRGG